MGRLQPDGLGDAEAGGVADAQNRPVLEEWHAREKLLDFRAAEHDGKV